MRESLRKEFTITEDGVVARIEFAGEKKDDWTDCTLEYMCVSPAL